MRIAWTVHKTKDRHQFSRGSNYCCAVGDTYSSHSRVTFVRTHTVDSLMGVNVLRGY